MQANVNFAPMSPRVVSVRAADDPYKKYWWMILGGFALTGLWLFMPMMETSVGSTRVDASALASSGDGQSLDSALNPNGAPGEAIDLSMDPQRQGKGGLDDPTSMLYQPLEDGGGLAGGSPIGGSASASLAQELKDVGKKDAGGWGEKAQRGFEMPRIGLKGSLSGFGSSSGGSSASAGGGASAFGANLAAVGYASTKGLRDGSAGGRGSGGMQALRNASNAAKEAAASTSGDKALGSLSRAFDNASKQNAIGGAGGAGGAYARLDSAPANLKTNDAKLDHKEIKVPPTTEAKSSKDDGDEMKKQLIMMAAGALINGVVGGVVGSIFSSAVTNQKVTEGNKDAETHSTSKSQTSSATQLKSI